MKRLIALILAGLMVLGGVCFAAQWPEGRSAAQPYSHLPEVNLEETMGYIMLFPRAKLPVTRFCDVLGMYLPREDLELGEGLAHLYERVEGEKEPVEVCTVDFADPGSVVIRDMNEKELSDLMWGGGTCVEMILPKSLEFGDESHDYFVLMDDGCYTAADGKLSSLQITSEEAWVPVITGDYGISGLYYIDAELPVEQDAEEAVDEEDEDEEEIVGVNGITDIVIADDDEEDTKAPEETEAPEDEEDEDEQEPEVNAAKADQAEDEAEEDAEEEAEEDVPVDPSQYVVKPDSGDKVYFDLVIGGDARLAVLYSDNGSVEFDEIEYAQSGPVVGTVVGDDVQWGVAFLDENDYIFDTIDIAR